MDVEENPRQVGEVIQLQQAAYAALGKAEGKGLSKKGKVKRKGKMVCSSLSLDQRRAKVVEPKSPLQVLEVRRYWPLGRGCSVQERHRQSMIIPQHTLQT